MINEDIPGQHSRPDHRNAGLSMDHQEHPPHDGNDSANDLFPAHLHHQHEHAHVNSNNPTENKHLSAGTDLVHPHRMTHDAFRSIHPPHHHPGLLESDHHHHHHHRPQPSPQYPQLQHPQRQTDHHGLHGLLHHHQQPAQQEQLGFSFHHPTHASGGEANNDIVNPTAALQHNVGVDVAGMHQHHHTELTSLSNRHHQGQQISPPQMLHQPQDHPMGLAMVYPSERFNNHEPFRPPVDIHEDNRQLQEARVSQPEQPLTPPPEESPQHMGMEIFPSRHSPIPLEESEPQRKQPAKVSPKKRKSQSKRIKTGKTSLATKNRVETKSHNYLVAEINGQGLLSGDEELLGTRPKKTRRRRYDNHFKAEILERLKEPHAKVIDVAKHYRIPENTVREWTKSNVAKAIHTARAKNTGDLKANLSDPLSRLTEILVDFFEENRGKPETTRQSITTKLIVAKGLEAKATLLRKHEANAFLDEKELKALKLFGGSDSWAKKFAKRHHLKMSGARIKELSEADVNKYHQSLREISTRVQQAGPGYEEVATLIRQAAEKLLCSRIIHSTASQYNQHQVNNGKNLTRRFKYQKSKEDIYNQEDPSKVEVEDEVEIQVLQQVLDETPSGSDGKNLSLA